MITSKKNWQIWVSPHIFSEKIFCWRGYRWFWVAYVMAWWYTQFHPHAEVRILKRAPEPPKETSV